MFYRFGDYELDDHLYQLRHNGAPLAVEPKVFDALVYLIQHHDRVVSKDELLAKLWPGQVVSETALTQCVMTARKAVGDDGTHQHTIKTQHGRGYRFVAPLTTSQSVQGSMFQVPGREEESQNSKGKNQKVKSENGLESSVQGLASETSEDFLHNNQLLGLRHQTLASPAPARPWPSRNLAWLGVVFLISAGVFLFHFSSLRIPQSAIRNPGEVPSPLPLPDKPSIIVLPFVNLSGDPTQEYFSDGMTEEITASLSRLSSLFVIARTSAFTYKGKTAKVQNISREMGVRYVLEGSVRKAGNQVRVTTQLIDAVTGGHLWSERYDRPFSDIFAVQDEMRQKIVFALKVQLTPEEQGRLHRFPTDSLDAYDYFLRSLEFGFPGTKEANVQFRQMCERALELDPHYAAAYARLSQSYLWEWFSYGGPEQTLERASDFAQKAVALDESLPFAHFVLGWVYVMQKQHDQAQTEMERAVTLDPNFATGYEGLSFVLHSSGKPQEAIAAATKAVRLAPQQLTNLNALGSAYVSAGQYEEAIAIFKKILARHPDFWPAHWGLTVIYSELGREEEAKTEGAEILRIIPNFSLERWKQRVFFKDAAEAERFAAALRKAGLK